MKAIKIIKHLELISIKANDQGPRKPICSIIEKTRVLARIITN